MCFVRVEKISQYVFPIRILLSFVLLVLLQVCVSEIFRVIVVFILSLSIYWNHLENTSLSSTFCGFLFIIFALKLLLAGLLFYNGYVFSDSLAYMERINDIESLEAISFNSLASKLETHHVMYYVLNYILFNLFGKTFYVLVFANVLFANIGLLIHHEIACRIAGRKVADYLLLILVFSANITLFSSLILKDALVLMLLAMAIRSWLNFHEGPSMIQFVKLVFISGMLLATRIYAGICICLLCAISLFKISRNIRTFTRYIVALALIMIYVIPSGYPILINIFLSKIRLLDILTGLPLQLISFYTSPVITRYGSIFPYYLPLVIETPFLSIFALYNISFWIKVVNDRRLRLALAVIAIPVLVFAGVLSLEYQSSAVRQKVPVMPLLYLAPVIGAFYDRARLSVKN